MRCDDLHSPMKPGVINCASTRPASAGGDGAKSGGELPAHAVHHFAQSTQQTPACEQAPPSLEEPPSLEAPPSRECITGSFSHGGNNGGESVLLVSAHSSRRTSCA